VTRLTATEVARSFSAVLNRVAAGEEIEILRNRAVVAQLSQPRRRLLSADRFRELLETAPPIDDEFAADVQTIRAEAGPPESHWAS
jgi:antitoxin (DNA-binding transcriptional repressor) of toxin-antitoxin stability system